MKKPGDFTSLSKDYAAFRPSYSEKIIPIALTLLGKTANELESTDIGAGTGIWTRMLKNAGFRSIVAIEPNEEMRNIGYLNKENGNNIIWQNGTGESTLLKKSSTDFVTIATALHWMNFDQSMAEVNRILRDGGCFIALWNYRCRSDNIIMKEIEMYRNKLIGNNAKNHIQYDNIQLITEKIERLKYFKEVVSCQASHMEVITPLHYIGLLKSVNNLQSKLSDLDFNKLIKFTEEKTLKMDLLEILYKTFAWIALK